MPRGLSAYAVNEINSLNSGDAFLFLMTIISGATTIRVVNNNEDVISNNLVYTAYPFSLVLAADDADVMPSAKLLIDNVDRALVDSVRQAQTAPTVEIQLILASRPNVVEMLVPDMTMKNVSYNELTMSATLYVGDVMNQKFPADIVTPTTNQGLF